jgi:phosphoribosylanthranilate isomerase
MQRVRVKIEGLRDGETALRIAQMGADAIGVVFAERSPRWVSPEQAAEVVAALPPWVSVVGVFVNSPPEVVNRVAERTGIHYAQLHGEEPPGHLADLAVPCIKAFRVRDEQWLGEVYQWLEGLGNGPRPAAVLLDAYNPEAHGGTGQRFNWQMVADARAAGKIDLLEPLILAGGLDDRCVAGAIELVRPWGVDVASGVEKAPGVKDLKKVESFLRATREGHELHSAFWRKTR